MILSDPFDCDTDPCHMAWLIRDNPSLLPAVEGATCSNGLNFNQLNQLNYTNCTSVYR